MDADSIKGNTTTIATWIITLIGSTYGISQATQNDWITVAGAIIVAAINYYNMKYNNTILEPENAVVGESDERAA